MAKQISFLPAKRRPNPQFWESDWDYYDALAEANQKYWNSKPLSLGEDDFEEDLNAEVCHRDSEN